MTSVIKTVIFNKVTALCLVFSFIDAVHIPVVVFPSPDETVYSAKRLIPALEIARDIISERVEFGAYANFTISWFISETGCSYAERFSVGIAAQRFFLENASAFFGPACSSNMLSVGDLAASLNIPVLSGSASSHELDNKDRYVTLTQTVYKPSMMVSFVEQLFEIYKWDSCTLIRSVPDIFTNAGEALEEGLLEEERRVIILELNDTNNDFEYVLKEASKNTRSKYEIGNFESLTPPPPPPHTHLITNCFLFS